jgi:DnaJ-class molecular chaperone
MVQREVVIEVKPGWKEGTKIKFTAIPSFPLTVVFVLNVQPHRYLERIGNDLRYQCTLSRRQLEKGVSIKIPMIDGSVLVYNTTELSSSIKDGFSKVFPGLGMPASSKVPQRKQDIQHPGEHKRGNFEILFRVVP